MLPLLLSKHSRNKIETHLLSLDAESNRLRFGYAASPNAIRSYLDRSFDDHSTWFGYVDHGVCIGAAHAYIDDGGVAELGISIDQKYRGNGLSSTLFERVLLYLKSQGVKTVVMQCLSENQIMQHLARKYGMRVLTLSPGEKHASIGIDDSNTVVNKVLDASHDVLSLVDAGVRNQLWLAEVVQNLFSSYLPKGIK